MTHTATPPSASTATPGMTVVGLRNFVEFAVRKEQQRLADARDRAANFDLPPDEAAIDAKDDAHKARLNASREYRQATAERDAIAAESMRLKSMSETAGFMRRRLLGFAGGLLASRAAVYGQSIIDKAAKRIPEADFQRELARLSAGRETRRRQFHALQDAAIQAESKLDLVEDRLLKVWQLEQLGVVDFGDKHLPQVNDAVIESTLTDARGRLASDNAVTVFARLSACHRQSHFAPALLPAEKANGYIADSIKAAKDLRAALLETEEGRVLLKTADPLLSDWMAKVLPPVPAAMVDDKPPATPPVTRRRVMA